MIKAIGAILLAGGAALIGISASSELTARVRTLAMFCRALEIMRSEIAEMLSPLESILQKLAREMPEPFCGFFSECAEEMKRRGDIPFGIIWKKQLSHNAALTLGAREKEELVSLGNVLGRYSADEQRISIERTLRTLESILTVADSDRKRLGGLYAKLGIICGISVVIVFI